MDGVEGETCCARLMPNYNRQLIVNKHEFKQRFEKLSTGDIRYRLSIGFLVKEAAIAYREILEERGEWVDESVKVLKVDCP